MAKPARQYETQVTVCDVRPTGKEAARKVTPSSAVERKKMACHSVPRCHTYLFSIAFNIGVRNVGGTCENEKCLSLSARAAPYHCLTLDTAD